MRKNVLLVALLLGSGVSIQAIPWRKVEKDAPSMLQVVAKSGDKALTEVTAGRVLEEELYQQLMKEGWTRDEVIRLMDGYLKNRYQGHKGSNHYSRYAKQTRPYWASQLASGDQMTEEAVPEVAHSPGYDPATMAGDDYLPRKFYNIEDRMNGKRDIGLFRHNAVLPSGGRIHWITVHPDNADRLMVIPDGDAIWRTDNMGKNWTCITDKIPNRYHRSVSNGYAIPVDPDDWNHVFAFMNNGGNGGSNPVYETFDGGDTWALVPNASHKGFKRGYAFRDSKGKLKFIGANPNDQWVGSKLWISDNKGVNWREITMPAADLDTHPVSGAKGFWFQEFAFDPTNRDIIYVPTSQSILRSTDGGDTFHKMSFKVYNQAGTSLRKEGTTFPLAASSPMFLNVNPNNPNQMWAALSVRNGNATALYYSEDKGETWVTLQEPSAGIGSGTVFGNEAPWNWLGGFGVNFNDPNYIYGCSMSSGYSTNGGKSFSELSWPTVIEGYYPDGNLYATSCSRHNADNHCIVPHKSGRVFRGSDGGMFMKDNNINNNKWVNISGDMGQILFYNIAVNEFGAQSIVGNTQDIDNQTYRNGRWGYWRGYEGNTVWMNPYSSEEHFPSKSSSGTILENQDYNSWNMGRSSANVCTGNWFIQRDGLNPDGTRFGIVKDFGRTSTGLKVVNSANITDYTLARDKAKGRVFVLNGSLYYSDNEGLGYKTITRPMGLTDWKSVAVNPDNSDEVYITRQGKVYRSDDIGGTWNDISYNLSSEIAVTKLYYHEGSGDLYLIAANHGIFLLENGSTNWRLWMKGYNPAAFSRAYINYTTQEMVISDYGRGVWIADLEHPSDRYFKEGFALKELGNTEGKRTIGRDTHWTIPMIYNHQWLVNGEAVEGNNSQYLTADLKPGDRVQLVQTMMQSPDIVTSSAELVIAESQETERTTGRGNYISSNGKGRIDLGYVDLFSNDFSIDMWVKPESNGVILANRQLSTCSSKGWLLLVNDGVLQFRYAPDHLFDVPQNERVNGSNPVQEATVSGGKVNMNEWNHITVTQERNGKIVLYVNGAKKGEGNRILPEHNLNNAVYLSLFADGYEYNAITAGVDELRIWGNVLKADDITRLMYLSEEGEGNQLLYRNTFNEATIDAQRETFSQKGMQVRTRAEVTFEPSGLPIGASYLASSGFEGDTISFVDKDMEFARVERLKATSKPTITIARFDDKFVFNEKGNLNPKFHDVDNTSFYVSYAGHSAYLNDTVKVWLNVGDKAKGLNKELVFVNEKLGENLKWTEIAQLEYDEESGMLWFKTKGANINQREILIVKRKPAIELSLSSTFITDYEVFKAEENFMHIEAQLVGGYEEPKAPYALTANTKGVKFKNELQFINGKAATEMEINMDSIGVCGDSREIIISSVEETVIPRYVTVHNRIAPKTNAKGLSFNGGGATVGEASNFAEINGSNTLTLAGWFRIDDATMLSGMQPLMMFRGGGVTLGVQLESGEIRCHWNEESWSWSTSSGLSVTSAQLGEWFHLAMVADANGLTYYLNGRSSRISRTMNKTAVLAPLMIGKNNSSSNTFKGAADQVSVWSRTLNREEIMDLMHGTPDLSNGNLCFLTLDARKNNQFSDLRQSMPVSLSGSSNDIVTTTIPYNYSAQKFGYGPSSDLASEIGMGIGVASTVGNYAITRFDDFPTKSTEGIENGFVPLQQAFYTVVSDKAPSTTTATVYVERPSLEVGDIVMMATRPLGSEGAFTAFTKVTVEEAGKAKIASKMNALAPMQVMFYVKSANSGEALKTSFRALPKEQIVLGNNDVTIPIELEYLSGVTTKSTTLKVDQPYAKLDKTSAKFSSTVYVSKHTLTIDQSMLNQFGWNTITVSSPSAETLQFEVALEPVVRLRLKNGTGENDITSNNKRADLQIETELLQGVLEGNLELETTTNANHSLMTGMGTLLFETPVSALPIYHSAGADAAEAGWSLIGNPYLSGINVTKSSNATFTGMTRYVYQYDAAVNNYRAVDMYAFDAQQQIDPMTAFFVQATEENANLTVYPTAKDTKLTKRNMYGVSARAIERVVVELSKNEQLLDETVINFEPDASNAFNVGEDAVKLWSVNEGATSIFTKAGETAVAINTIPQKGRVEIPLFVKATEGGTYTLATKEAFNVLGGNVILKDNVAGTEVNLNGTSTQVVIESATDRDGRYSLIIVRDMSNESIDKENGYMIYVEPNQCVIKGLDGDVRVAIYDISGRLVSDEVTHNEEHRVTLSEGSYIVKLRKDKKEFSNKIYVK